MIKMIASDLDGTLLQNGAQHLTPRAVVLIRRLTRKGLHFVAASGRPHFISMTAYGLLFSSPSSMTIRSLSLAMPG